MDIPSLILFVALLFLQAFVLKHRLWVLACALPIGVLALFLLSYIFHFYYNVVFLRTSLPGSFVGWGGASFLIAFQKHKKDTSSQNQPKK